MVLMLSFSTDETLFRNDPVDLPQIGIGISIQQSYILAPLIVLYLHIQILYLLSVLARKMEFFRKEKQRHLNELSAFAFIQLFGERSLSSPLPWFLIWFGVMAIPLVLLFAMGLSFVRFQSDVITWEHRVIFVIDLVFVLWFVWAVLPNSMNRYCDEPRESRAVRRVIHAIMILILILIFYIDLSIYQPNEIIIDIIKYCIIFIICLIIYLICLASVVWLIEPMCPDRGPFRCIIQAVPDVMKLSTTMVAICMALFLYHSVRPPHFDPETINKDRECIWGHGDKKNDDCENYIDILLCPLLDICRYLNLHDEWLASTQSVDLAGLIPDELEDENAEDSRRSVNSLHVKDRNFRFANFGHAKLYGADFSRAKLEGANFRSAQLHSVIFREAQLRNTDFCRSEANNSIFHEAKSQSANFRFSALQKANFSKAQLQGSDFMNARMTGAFFREAGLQGVNFGKARLQVTDFWKAKLQGVNFEDAKLDGAELVRAKLQGVNFSGARLEGVDLGEAQLQGSFVVNEANKGESMGSWDLAWMPYVSFSFCNCAEQYMEDKNIKLAWEENKTDDGQCGESVQGTSLKAHLDDYLAPKADRTKLDCKLLKERGKENDGPTICFEPGFEPGYVLGSRHGFSYGHYNYYIVKLTNGHYYYDIAKLTKNLPDWMNKLACNDKYAADRIHSRWMKNSDILLSSSNNIIPTGIKQMRENIFKVLDCERRKKDKSRCLGLQSISDGRWSQLWAKLDYDLSEPSCINPNPPSQSPALPVR